MAVPPAADRPPIPPADLLLRVVPSFSEDEIDANRVAFDLGAIGHLECFERALALQGSALTDFERLLDFGCGCGRFLRHLGSVADVVEIHGTDIDNDLVHWVRTNIPFARAEIAPHEPPLPYPDEHFDLVINHSVFTHLDERYQDLWLGELRRISRPGGLLLLTVEGQSTWNRICDSDPGLLGTNIEGWRDELESRGILFIRDDLFVGSTHPDFYHSTIHAPWYVFEHWGQFFEVAAYLPDGSLTQDLIVLRRRADGAGPSRPIRHRSSPGGPPPLRAAPRGPKNVRTALSGARRMRSPLHNAADEDEVSRELMMLRAGLKEQGNRISVLAKELRREIQSLDETDNG